MTFINDSVYNKVVADYFGACASIGSEVVSRYTTQTSWMTAGTTFTDFLHQCLRSMNVTTDLSTLSSITSIPKDYRVQAHNYFPSRSEEDLILLWKAFLLSKGYTKSPSDAEIESDLLRSSFTSFLASIHNVEATVVEDLRTFVQSYNAFGFDINVLSMTDISSIPNGWFKDTLKAYYGDASDIEQLDLWRAFLCWKGYTEIPEQIDTTENRASFITFLQAHTVHHNRYAETTLSKETIAQQFILLDVIDSVRTMINVTQQLIQIEAANLIQITDKQKEYTAMISRVPNLVSGKGATITLPSTTLTENAINNWDLSSFILGYNSLSARDVIDWGIDSCINNPGKTYTFTHSDTSPLFTFSFVLNDESLQLSFSSYASGQEISSSSSISLVNSAGDTVSRSSLLTEAETAYKGIFSSSQNMMNALLSANGKASIPGRFLNPIDLSADIATLIAAKPDITARAEQNAVLQKYINNIRSLRTLSQQPATLMRSTLEKTKTALDQHLKLLTSLLECQSNVMHAITT